VTALPDPTLMLGQFLRTPETRVGPQTTSLSLQQRLPWFGKLDEKGKVAAKEAAWRAEMVAAARADVVRQVKLAYYDLAFTDAAIALTEEELELLSHFEDLAQARYSQGVGLQQAVIKLQAEITRYQNRLEQLRARRVDAEATLNSLLDRPAATALPVTPATARPEPALILESLYEVANRQSPEMKAAFLRIEQEEKRIDVARKEYWPDFTVGLGFTNVLGRRDPAGLAAPPPANGKNIWNITVGVNLPIGRRKRDAAVLEATESLLASKESYRDQWNRLEAAIRATAFRLETVDEQIDLYESTLLPQAEQSLAASEAAYSTGEIGVLDLLDSERVLLDVRLGLAQLTSEYMKALAEMERALGVAFPEVTEQ
jgi:outer membrane protein TolC